MKKRRLIPRNYPVDLLKSAVILILATLLSLAFRAWHVREENILMVYLIAVIIISIEVKGYLWGTVCSVICVFTFNFLFTEPYYTFHVSDPNYILAMFLFLTVALMTEMLVSRLQEQIHIAKQNAEQTQSLFELTSGYLTISGLENILYYGIKSLYQILSMPCMIYVANDSTTLSKPYFVAAHFPDRSVIEDGTLAQWCFLNMTPCGTGTSFYNTSVWKYLPIKKGSKALAVIGIYCGDNDVPAEQTVFIDTILSQMATAISQESLYRDGNISAGENHSEQINRELMDRHTRRLPAALEKVVKNICPGGNTSQAYRYALTAYLTASNLRMIVSGAEQKNLLHKAISPFEETLTQVVNLYQRLKDSRTLRVSFPETRHEIPMDQRLISLALMNLLDNAFRHTKEKCEILVICSAEDKAILLRITDNGGGIPEEKLAHLFDAPEESPPAGLGLLLSKDIMESHYGKLSVQNNSDGGVTVSVTLPRQYRNK